MNKPTEKQLDAMVRLLNTEEFHTFIGWINESYLTEAQLSLVTEKEPQGRWMQGRAQQLGYMIEYLKTARASLEAVEETRKREER